MNYKTLELMKVKLLREGINLRLYKEPVDKIGSRVTVCNGLFLEYNLGNDKRSIKVRINPKSPYFLINRDKRLQMIDEEGNVFLEEVYLKKKNINSKIFTEQLSGILAVSLYGCQLVNLGKQCNFCSSAKYLGPRFNKEEFKNELEVICAQKPVKAITINGGSFPNLQYRGYELMSNYIKIARNLDVKEINAELMPNPKIEMAELKNFLEKMKKDGVTSAQFNIEIWDLEKRVEMMPYKGLIPRETYLKYIKEGSEILGKGKISSVLLIGLNSIDGLSEGSKAIMDNGGVPSLEIFRPLPGTHLESFQEEYNLEEVLEITESIRKKIYIKFNGGKNFEGCLKCGGCGVTNNYSYSKNLKNKNLFKRKQVNLIKIK